MEKQYNQVGEFNKSFNILEQETPNARIKDDDKLLMYKLSREENDEYLEAVVQRDLVEVVDALGDELYILMGKFRKHGIPSECIEEIFDEIHRSNMSKLGKDGKPIYREDGKVLKGANYFKPNLKPIIEKYRIAKES